MKQYLLTLALIAAFSFARAQTEISTFADPTGNYSTASSGGCLGCSISNASAVADMDMTNSAVVTMGIAVLAQQTIRAKLPHVAPGHSYAGFLITTNSLLGILPVVSLTTYKNNVLRETVTSNASLASLLSGTIGFVCGQSNAILDYDEVGLTFTSVIASVAMTANVFYAYGGVATCPTMSTILPIGFSSADLNTPQGVPAINWTVETGEAAWYSIERSTDAKNFTETGRVNADASLDNHHFTYTDHNAPDSMSWYRIGAHSADGKTGYSKILTFAPSTMAERGVRIFPNPVNSHFTVQAEGFSGNGVVEIYSLQGQLVEKQVSVTGGNNGIVSVNLSHPLNPGIYVLQLTDAGNNKKWRSKLVSR